MLPSRKMRARVLFSGGPLALRKLLRMTQTEFWEPLGVTQSCGSRYEKKSRHLTEIVAELMRIRYVEGVALEHITRENMLIIERLKSDHRDVYDHAYNQLKKGRKAA